MLKFPTPKRSGHDGGYVAPSSTVCAISPSLPQSMCALTLSNPCSRALIRSSTSCLLRPDEAA